VASAEREDGKWKMEKERRKGRREMEDGENEDGGERMAKVSPSSILHPLFFACVVFALAREPAN
jgi:hypothetical protein